MRGSIQSKTRVYIFTFDWYSKRMRGKMTSNGIVWNPTSSMKMFYIRMITNADWKNNDCIA